MSATAVRLTLVLGLLLSSLDVLQSLSLSKVLQSFNPLINDLSFYWRPEAGDRRLEDLVITSILILDLALKHLCQSLSIFGLFKEIFKRKLCTLYIRLYELGSLE